MKIVLIGAGNLATNLGKALFRSGHDILQVYSRTLESAEMLSRLVDAEPITDFALLCNDAEIFIVALKDYVVGDLVPQLCKGRERCFFAHTSGSLSMDVFKGHAVNYGVFYPLQTFSKFRELDFLEIPCFIEAVNEPTQKALSALASSVSKSVSVLPYEKRKQLHLAAVFACNFTNHCYALAEKLLKKEDIPFDVLLPLIDETARKIHGTSPLQTQTGPAVRNDRNVIQMHLDLLAGDDVARELYERMSRSIYNIEKKNQ